MTLRRKSYWASIVEGDHMKGIELLSPGVGVRHENGKAIGIIYGGYASNLDKQAAFEAARPVFEAYHEMIETVEIVVEREDAARFRVAAIARAQEKRERKRAAAAGRAWVGGRPN